MKIPKQVLIAAASSGFAIATIALGIAGTNPSPRAHPQALRMPRHDRAVAPKRNDATPEPCTTDFAAYSFVGIAPGASEIAAGDHAGVARGFENFACDADSGALMGENNSVGAAGDGGNAEVGNRRRPRE